jgi:hypothetical protein
MIIVRAGDLSATISKQKKRKSLRGGGLGGN